MLLNAPESLLKVEGLGVKGGRWLVNTYSLRSLEIEKQFHLVACQLFIVATAAAPPSYLLDYLS